MDHIVLSSREVVYKPRAERQQGKVLVEMEGGSTKERGGGKKGGVKESGRE